MQSSSLQGREAELLMHFLDHVFPRQYPAYKPSLFQGGRGWLLSLLMRTKPLYHAALSLSAYDQQSSLLLPQYRVCNKISWSDLERHHSLCLQELRHDIQALGKWLENRCFRSGVGVLASVVQLIFFEVYNLVFHPPLSHSTKI